MAERDADRTAAPAEKRIGRNALLAGGLGALVASVLAEVDTAEAVNGFVTETLFVQTNEQPGVFITTNTGSPLTASTENAFRAVSGHANHGIGMLGSTGDPNAIDLSKVATGTGVTGVGQRGVVGATIPLEFPISRAVTTGVYGHASAPSATAITAEHGDPKGYALEAYGCLAFSSAGLITIRPGRRRGIGRNPNVSRGDLVIATTQSPGSAVIESASARNGRVVVTLNEPAKKRTPVGYLGFTKR